MSALHDFIDAENDIQGLRELLRGGENPNSRDLSGGTPLHIAVLKCERNPQDTDDILLLARELINFGAVVDLGNNLARTPLHFAVGCRNCKMIETLLQSNAQIDQRDYEGYAALHFATSIRRFRRHILYDLDLSVVKLLLKYGPERDIRTRNRETALMLAVQNNNFQIVRELLMNKVSGNLQDLNGNSAMHYALRRPEVNVNIVLELMSHGCSFNMSNYFDYTPMTLYFYGLLDAQRISVDDAKFVFKLYVFDGNEFTYFQHMYMKQISKKNNCQLSRFVLLCNLEIEQMRADALTPNFNVYDIASRGVYYSVSENNKHIPFEVFDKVLDKLMRRQYPLYYDLIAAGICTSYLNKKFAELCCCVEIGNKFLDDGVLYSLSLYLSHFDMLNMMIACAGVRRRFWYLPHFACNTRCSVS